MIINKVNTVKKLPKKLRVCAYARVSTGKDAMLDSLANQVSYYSKFIQSKKEWLYVGVYSDEAISGTKSSRPGFQKMLTDSQNGKIDLIITKSISRFARNTVTLLETVRELKSIGVGVYFEEQRIHTLSKEGELMLTILASYAQEEARSVSDNMKWRVRKNFAEGIPYKLIILGYRLTNGKITIVPEEAEVVKLIYKKYLEGKGLLTIAKELNQMNILTRFGNKFTHNSIRLILTNITYTGDLLLQKKYRNNYLEKKTTWNKGELPQYYVEDSHEPIIDKKTFAMVQEMIKANAKKRPISLKTNDCFYKGMVKCGHCGRAYLKKTTIQGRHAIWRCSNYIMNGKGVCSNPGVIDDEIIRLAKMTLGLEEISKEVFLKEIKEIIVNENKTLTFRFYSGKEATYPFSDYSRKDSWTPEMKQKARERSLKQWQKLQ